MARTLTPPAPVTLAQFDAIATDFDGTLAHDGHVDAATVDELLRARSQGLKMVLVTGRELTSLSNTFDHVDVFDRVVAENGAVVLNPETGHVRLLASPPPAALVQRLT